MKKYALLAVLIVFVLSSCTKNNPVAPKSAGKISQAKNDVVIPVLPVNVYVSGVELGGGNKAVYWRNNVMTKLDSGGNTAADAIALKGSTVYVVGWDHLSKPVCWVNGVPQSLATTSTNSTPLAVAFNGSDVYVAGTESVGSVQNAVLWKNGVKQSLGINTSVNSTAKAVMVSAAGDIYVAGSTTLSGQSIATYWKNGVATLLSTVRVSSSASAITVSGANVYVAGLSNSKMVYWVNGTINVLPDLGYGGQTSDILTVGTDVYVSGSANLSSGNTNAVYWKNGVATYVLNRGAVSTTYVKMSYAYGNLYFAGMLVDLSHFQNGVYWEGTAVTYLSPDGFVTGMTTSPF